MTTSIPARRSPDGYVAQQMPDRDGTLRWVRTSLDTDGFIQIYVLEDEAVADWPVLGEVVELEAIAAEPPTLVLGPEQVLIVALDGDRTEGGGPRDPRAAARAPRRRRRPGHHRRAGPRRRASTSRSPTG